ncbi:MAG: penicillin acylase family protein [Frankiaceae bacterium]|nr:penicillin acylase family protein [Frankiaceae bacterium]
MLRRTSVLSALAAMSVLSFVAPTSAATHSAAAAKPPHPPAERLAARTALPPGESGQFAITDLFQYTVDGNPEDYGPHVDDQREMYWNNKTKDANFAKPKGTPATPKAGVRIYRDSYDVPLIYGKNGYDVWYGAGYAAATDRLFEMDAIRRLGEGRLAELTGTGAVPADLQERILTYTHREYRHMFRELPKPGREAIRGYAAGTQKRIEEVRAAPDELPGEYVLLSMLPAKWTVEDSMAAGVFITRNIASQGGLEMANVAILLELEQKFGKVNGRQLYADLFPDDEANAAVTIHGRHFSNLAKGDRSPAAMARNALTAMKYAEHIPLGVALGPGTGDSPAPPAAPAAAPNVSARRAAQVRQAVVSINRWAHSLHGGSFAYAISGKRTKNGHAMVSSNPQLDYSYPSELYELEVHGGGYNARGIGVPSIPTVGIGHTDKVAWALTTGYSKTIDSFIERQRKNPVPGGAPQYLHHGFWHNERCRDVTVNYRATGPDGVPAGPADQSQTSQVCRTMHGPIVASTKNGKWARSVSYAQWLQDDQTVSGILAWDRAKNLHQVAAGVKKVRWNENIVAADSKGHIGYWHPGRYFRRAAGTDQRFPLDGTHGQEMQGYIPFRKMPHVVDPKDGYVANWNNKPAVGWVDGDLSGSNTRPGGPIGRISDLQAQLESSRHFTPASMAKIEKTVGEDDHAYRGYLPVLHKLRHLSGLSVTERKAVALLNHWDGRAYAPGEKGGSSDRSTPAGKVTDGPAATVFRAYITRVKALLFHNLPADIRARLDTLDPEAHQYDVTPLDNDALGVLLPGYSAINGGLGAARRADIEKRALVQAVKVMKKRYGKAPNAWRRHHGISHVNALSGVVGPSEEMPFQDRGTWVQEVAFTSGTAR